MDVVQPPVALVRPQNRAATRLELVFIWATNHLFFLPDDVLGVLR